MNRKFKKTNAVGVYILIAFILVWPSYFPKGHPSGSSIVWKTDGEYLYTCTSNELKQWDQHFYLKHTYILTEMQEMKMFSANSEIFFWINSSKEGYLYFLESQETFPFGLHSESSYH